MARCAPVSRDTLLANFLQMPSEVVDNLRTLIVGGDYAVRKHVVSTLTNYIGAYDEAAGVTAAWPDLGATEEVDLTTVQVFISQCLVRYFLEAVGVPSASNGEQNGSVANEILHDSGNTIWAGPNRTVNVATDVVVGDHIYLDTDGAGANAFETTVIGFKYTAGDPTVLVLADNLPAALTGGANFNVNVDEVVASQELASTDFTATSTQISVSAAVTVTTTRVGSAKPVYSGSSPYSQTFVDYRALRQDNVSDVISITHEDQLDTYFVGWEYPESGLGFSMARALAPQPSPELSALPAVLGAAISANTSTGWSDVLSRVKRRTDWYTLAPLTLDTTFQALAVQTVSDREALGLDSRVFLCRTLTTTTNLYTGTESIALSGGDLTITATNPIFTSAVAGDTVTTDVGVRIIESKTSNQEVVVTAVATGATEVTSVDHPMSVAEQADAYGAEAQAFADSDVSVIFPPDPTWEGEVVDGFLYAAACAGLRGYTMPHQSLRGALMETGWAVPQSAYTFLGELSDLGTYGCFVSEDYSGSAVVLYAYTTDQSSTQTRLEALVANTDAVTRYFNDLVACYAGRTKVTTDTLTALRNACSTGIEFLKSNTLVSGYGTIIVDGTIGAPYQDTSNLDTVIIPIAITLSTPLEVVTLDITVTLEII